MAIFFILSGTTFNPPTDWPGTGTAEGIGGGGAGSEANDSPGIGCGGEGGYYSKKNTVSALKGASCQVGTGGSTKGANGTSTWFISTATMRAPGGKGGVIATNTLTSGGNGDTQAGDVQNSGGSTGLSANTAFNKPVTGGGGAAGPQGNGGASAGDNNNLNGGGCGGGGAGGGGSGTVGGAAGDPSGNAGSNGGNNAAGSGHGSGSPASGTSPTAGSNGGGGGGGWGNDTTASSAGANGGAGADWTSTNGQGSAGAGGGGGANGSQNTSGSANAPGAGGLYGGGGAGGGVAGYVNFGPGANGIIVLTYTSALDGLTTATNTDLVLYNQNWNYTNEASTNFILVGPNGAFCNNQSGANTVNALWAGAQFTADQQAQCVLVSFVTGAYGGVGVRFSNGAVGPNGYVAFFDTGHYNIGVLNNGAFTSLTGGPQARTNNTNDIILLQVQGSTITLFVNTVTLKTVTDTTWTQGSPGISFSGTHPSTVISGFFAKSLGILTPSYQVTSVIGQLGGQVSEALSNQTIASSSSSSGLTVSIATRSLIQLNMTFAEGQLVDVLNIGGQTATFAEGALTFTITGGATLTLGGQTLGFVGGQLFDNISYLLDQGSQVANLIGQISTFTQGSFSFSVVPQLTASTSPGTVGVPTTSLTLASPTAQSLTSVEGVLTATLGTNIMTFLVGQTLASSEGLLSENIGYFPSAETGTFVVGSITFSNSGNFIIQLSGQLGTFSQGTIRLQLPANVYPNMTGLLLEDATQRLEVLGAVVPASIGYFGTWPISVIWVPNQLPPFVVVSQSVPAGAPIVANAPITLTVSQPNENVAYP